MEMCVSRSRFLFKMVEDDLYLGYYLHLIQDLFFRNFVYHRCHWQPHVVVPPQKCFYKSILAQSHQQVTFFISCNHASYSPIISIPSGNFRVLWTHSFLQKIIRYVYSPLFSKLLTRSHIEGGTFYDYTHIFCITWLLQIKNAGNSSPIKSYESGDVHELYKKNRI